MSSLAVFEAAAWVK